MDLPADTLSVVELRGEDDTGHPLLAEQRLRLDGRQAPLAFELLVPRQRLQPGRRFLLQAALVSPGKPPWVSEPLMIEPGSGVADVGMLIVQPQRSSGAASAAVGRPPG